MSVSDIMDEIRGHLATGSPEVFDATHWMIHFAKPRVISLKITEKGLPMPFETYGQPPRRIAIVGGGISGMAAAA